MRTRLAFLPAAPVLLPEYAGLEDPVAPLRAACLDAVTWLAKDAGEVLQVLAPPPDPANRARGVATSVGTRLADHLADSCGFGGRLEPTDGSEPGEAVLVLGNGSARRGEKSPGHLDARSTAFDEAVLGALAGADPGGLAGLDEPLGDELLADGIAGLRAVGRTLGGHDVVASVLYADAPYGVQYWVVTWECVS
jgi:hypothetical protein